MPAILNSPDPGQSMDDTDFAEKTVLVARGSSDIGSGVARAFKARDAQVHAWRARVAAAGYPDVHGCDFSRDDASAEQFPLVSPPALGASRKFGAVAR